MSFPPPLDLLNGIDVLARCISAEAALREAASDEQQRGDSGVMKAAHDQAVKNVVECARKLLTVVPPHAASIITDSAVKLENAILRIAELKSALALAHELAGRDCEHCGATDIPLSVVKIGDELQRVCTECAAK